jgi:beta-1,4-mannosyltransferase
LTCPAQVSSTSWTPDEDLGMLLRAAKLYDDAASSATSGATLPRMLLIVTGKGPLRCAFEREAQLLALRHVAIRTAFLTAEDYALLLGSADLGISLHASSSGLDLPMKVVDMFGASLPVAALGYATLAELVNPGVNGVTFADAKQLAGHLRTVLAGFAGGEDDVAGGPTPTLARLRQGAAAWAAVRWDQEWLRVAAPLFTDAP